MYLGQQQDHAGSPARSYTPTDQPQRKPVGRWYFISRQRGPGVVGWQIEVVGGRMAEMPLFAVVVSWVLDRILSVITMALSSLLERTPV